MTVLQKLLESRAAAQKTYDEFVNPLIESGEELTEDQQTRRGALRSAVQTLDARIDEVEAEEKRATKLAEVRKGIGTGQPALEVNEPTTYGPDSPNSYYLDLIFASQPADSRFTEARARLQAGSHEAAVEMVSSSKPEVRRKLRKIIAEEKRNTDEHGVREAIKRAEALGATGRSELRTGMDTTAGSGGSFATPVYFIGDYAPYREAGRPFIDECNKQDLPAYGMTVYLPHVTGPAGVASQASQNTGVQETDPTAGYLSANLTTEAGQVIVSQQLLDRAGPGFAFDKLVFDQLNRDYAPKVDAFALNVALAGAGSIAYTATSFQLNVANGVGGFYSKVAGGKAAIRKAAGVVMAPTHLFMIPDRWEYIEGWADGNARPVVVPNYAGPWNALGAGSPEGDAGTIDGATGYKLAGLPVFTDLSIPTPTVGNDQAIVGNLREVYVWEGTPVTRVLPQTLGNQLSVILQQYSYIAGIVRYPTAVQTVSGTGMAAIAF